MAENLILQIGDLRGEPREIENPDRFEVRMTLGLNNERRYDKEAGGWVDGTASFLDVACFGQLAKHILDSNWTSGLKIMAYGHLANNDSIDPSTGKTIPAFILKAVHAGPSAQRGPVTVVKTAKPRRKPVRVGDTFAQIANELNEAQRRRTEAAAETPAAA